MSSWPAPNDREPERSDWSVVKERLRELVAVPGVLLVVSDFDGTLAPISAEPMATRILPRGRAALRRLARIGEERPDRLAVVVLSGRTAADVAGRVRVGGVRYYGNHGLEGGPLPRRTPPERLAVAVDPAFAPHARAVPGVARAVADRLGRPDWLFVEEKGPSIAFHFRRAPDGDVARAELLAAIDDAETAAGDVGLVRLEGRRVVELRPSGAGHKGAAFARLLTEERPAAALMLGDDRSDAEAFAVIREARERGRITAGLALGVHGAAETPTEIVAAADIVLADPTEAARALGELARLLEREAGD